METKKRKGKCRHHTLIQTYRGYSHLKKSKNSLRGRIKKKQRQKNQIPCAIFQKQISFIHPKFLTKKEQSVKANKKKVIKNLSSKCRVPRQTRCPILPTTDPLSRPPRRVVVRVRPGNTRCWRRCTKRFLRQLRRVSV